MKINLSGQHEINQVDYYQLLRKVLTHLKEDEHPPLSESTYLIHQRSKKEIEAIADIEEEIDQ